MSKIVIALGGNALQSKNSKPTSEGQLQVVRHTCGRLAEISAQGYEMSIVHGNGPQVGRILLAFEAAKDVTPAMPFDVCGAMSQGYIGYHIQQALKYALSVRNKHCPVVTVATQLVVDKDDKAFENPTKPIGPFYTEEEAKQLIQEKGYVMKEDAGRGWRRVVASPTPRKIVEIDAIKNLWKSTIVVSCGGGGIPVIKNENGDYTGVPAVIDKDFASAKLAELVDADYLFILTAVDHVAVNFGRPDQMQLTEMTVDQAREYCSQGQFAAGSMLPKVQAAMAFAESKKGRNAVIASLEKAPLAMVGKSGTRIYQG